MNSEKLKEKWKDFLDGVDPKDHATLIALLENQTKNLDEGIASFNSPNLWPYSQMFKNKKENTDVCS